MDYHVKSDFKYEDGTRIFPKEVEFTQIGLGEIIWDLDRNSEMTIIGSWLDYICRPSLVNIETNTIKKNHSIHDDFEIKEKVSIEISTLLGWLKRRDHDDEFVFNKLKQSYTEAKSFEEICNFFDLKYYRFSNKNFVLNDLLNVKYYHLIKNFNLVFDNLLQKLGPESRGNISGVIPYLIELYDDIFFNDEIQLDLLQGVEPAYHKRISYQTAQKFTKQVKIHFQNRLKSIDNIKKAELIREANLRKEVDDKIKDKELLSLNLSAKETASIFDLFLSIELISAPTKSNVINWMNQSIKTISGNPITVPSLRNNMNFEKNWTPRIHDFISEMKIKSLAIRNKKEKNKNN